MLLRKQAPVPDRRDWYRSASEEDRREYDAFGPWICDVRDEAEMPRVFRDAWRTVAEAPIVLKVPIDADRLQCRPGMNLYSTVLAVDDGGVTLLRLVAGSVENRRIGWSEIAAVGSYANLLIGRWTLLLGDGGEICVDHGAVGAARMSRVSGFVRAHIGGLDGTPAPRPDAAVAVTDLFFRNMLADAGRDAEKPVVAIHWEPPNRPCRNEANRRRLSTGVLFVDTPGELVIVDRERATRRRFHPTYASRATWVPWRSLSAWSFPAAEPEGPPRPRDLVLRLDRQTIRRPCLATPEAVVARLEAHGVPRVA
jgi:hypothetical protein